MLSKLALNVCAFFKKGYCKMHLNRLQNDVSKTKHKEKRIQFDHFSWKFEASFQSSAMLYFKKINAEKQTFFTQINLDFRRYVFRSDSLTISLISKSVCRLFFHDDVNVLHDK